MKGRWDEYPGTVGSEIEQLCRRVTAAQVVDECEGASVAVRFEPGLSSQCLSVTQQRGITRHVNIAAAQNDADSFPAHVEPAFERRCGS